VSYEAESRALDVEILGVIDAWHRRVETLSEERFTELALRLFEYQFRYNEPYARYCAALGVTSPPDSWEKIPAVPAPAFKDAAITTFDPARASLVFETSGTTVGTSGRHYMETPALYDAALLAGFDRFVLGDGARLRFLNLVPNPREHRHSSLGYMMERVSKERGSGRTEWYLRGDVLAVDTFLADAREAAAQRQAVCIAATAFALVHLLDAMEERGAAFALPPRSRLMETGGFKGRARSVDREELYARICDRLGMTQDAIVAEYGMTELTSQHYGTPRARAYQSPPWLRTRIVGPERTTLPTGMVGAVLHVDLANRSSCIAIQAEDLGMQTEEGLVLLGRASDAVLRGCSLDAEELRTRREAVRKS
jgi:hypothetical protein